VNNSCGHKLLEKLLVDEGYPATGIEADCYGIIVRAIKFKLKLSILTSLKRIA
jgi:hypothetical protein